MRRERAGLQLFTRRSGVSLGVLGKYVDCDAALSRVVVALLRLPFGQSLVFVERRVIEPYARRLLILVNHDNIARAEFIALLLDHTPKFSGFDRAEEQHIFTGCHIHSLPRDKARVFLQLFRKSHIIIPFLLYHINT